MTAGQDEAQVFNTIEICYKLGEDTGWLGAQTSKNNFG